MVLHPDTQLSPEVHFFRLSAPKFVCSVSHVSLERYRRKIPTVCRSAPRLHVRSAALDLGQPFVLIGPTRGRDAIAPTVVAKPFAPIGLIRNGFETWIVEVIRTRDAKTHISKRGKVSAMTAKADAFPPTSLIRSQSAPLIEPSYWTHPQSPTCTVSNVLHPRAHRTTPLGQHGTSKASMLEMCFP